MLSLPYRLFQVLLHAGVEVVVVVGALEEAEVVTVAVAGVDGELPEVEEEEVEEELLEDVVAEGVVEAEEEVDQKLL